MLETSAHALTVYFQIFSSVLDDDIVLVQANLFIAIFLENLNMRARAHSG